jgi:hypothetical protein
MNNIDREILQRVKKLYGDNCELVRRTEWSYSYKCGPKSFCSISRFMAEEGFEVSASEIRQRWPSMNEGERMDFASNFHVKESWTENGSEILEIIMNDGNEHIWSACALAMLRHPDPNRTVEFLMERVQRNESDRPPLNYIQALGIAGDRRAVPVIRPYYDKCLKAMGSEAVTGVPEDIFWGPIPYHAFLSIAAALFKIEGSNEYEQAIRKYLVHPNEQVCCWAEHALGIEGPATARKNAEYRKKRGKEE